MCQGGYPSILKLKVKQICGIILRVWHRLVTISQGTARNHFWEARMLMQSSILDIVQ